MKWIRDRALTLVLMAMFVASLAGQILTGMREYNASQHEHGQPPVALQGYLATGHPWEAPESRRPGVKELVDADPRDFAGEPDVPWPVRRGGWVLRVYEHSLGLAFVLLFLGSWVGHAAGGFAEYSGDQLAHGQPPPVFADYLLTPRFWFESFQNWQSEFLSIAVMVWLAVYLRQRGSPESKPVHAPHSETGR